MVTGNEMTPPVSQGKGPPTWAVPYLLLLLAALAVGGMMVYIHYEAHRMSVLHAPLVDAAMEVKLAATTGHLQFEEILSGKRHEGMDRVWAHYEQADWYARAMIAGGTNPEGTFLPLDDPDLRALIEEVRRDLTELRETARQRYQTRQSTAPGSAIDQAYDVIFHRLITTADDVETAIQQAIQKDLRVFQTTQVVLAVTALGLFVFVGLGFWGFERSRRVYVSLLAESERKHRELVEGTSDLIIQVDREGRFIFVNHLAEEIFGLLPAACVGLSISDFIHPDDRERIRTVFDAWIEARVQNATIETRQVSRTGKVHEMFWTINLHYDDEGRVTNIGGIARDIGELKRAELERLNLERQIQHAQKLESLGVLAGGIAHDFNNILMGVLGNAELALMQLPPENPARENVRLIETAAVRAADLAKQMLAYSGKGRFVVELINLNRVVEEMVHLLGAIISKKAMLKFNLAEDLPPIEADVTQIRQVFMNLVTNASEAIGDRSGVITVSTGVEAVNREYLTEMYLDENLPEGYYAYVEVTDTGRGMDRDTREKIFDPFFTTKFTGRGLGLAAVLGITRGHKGGIKVYSEPGRGTTFKVLFPCAEGHAGAMAEKAAALDDQWRGQGTILVVDDEESVRSVAKMALEQVGFDVLLAGDGRQGVRVFQQHAGEIVAVLLDMTMPHMGGEEAFRELRKIRSDVRVILSSGYDEQGVTDHFAGKDLAGFIQKPYLPTALIAKLRQVLKTM